MTNVPSRWLQRAEPRLLITVAAAGCALVVGGALLISGEGLGPDGVAGDSGSKAPGIILMAAVVAAGYLLVARFREGPLATTGSVAVAVGVPTLLFFVSFDAGGLPPYSTETILIGSTAVWLVTWFTGPARGRPVFLGLAAAGAWLSFLEITESVFSFPFLVFDSLFSAESGYDAVPEPSAIGAYSLLFGVGYLVLARAWDQRGWRGAATPLTAAGLLALPVGVGFLSDDLNAAGTGILATALGVALAWHGAAVQRRFTTWYGGVGIAFGVAAFLSDFVEDGTLAGFLLMLLGAGVITAAHALRTTIVESPEIPDGIPDPPPVHEF